MKKPDPLGISLLEVLVCLSIFIVAVLLSVPSAIEMASKQERLETTTPQMDRFASHIVTEFSQGRLRDDGGMLITAQKLLMDGPVTFQETISPTEPGHPSVGGLNVEITLELLDQKSGKASLSIGERNKQPKRIVFYANL